MTKVISHMLVQQPHGCFRLARKNEVARPGVSGHAVGQGVRQPGSVKPLGGARLPEQKTLDFRLDAQPTVWLAGKLLNAQQLPLHGWTHIKRGAHTPKTLQQLQIAQFEIALLEIRIMVNAFFQQKFLPA
ncbi:MAG: hypothetical protein ACK6AD_14105 [Cyanobacteriota bacterium]